MKETSHPALSLRWFCDGSPRDDGNRSFTPVSSRRGLNTHPPRPAVLPTTVHATASSSSPAVPVPAVVTWVKRRRRDGDNLPGRRLFIQVLLLTEAAPLGAGSMNDRCPQQDGGGDDAAIGLWLLSMPTAIQEPLTLDGTPPMRFTDV